MRQLYKKVNPRYNETLFLSHVYITPESETQEGLERANPADGRGFFSRGESTSDFSSP